ncbi:hypothetical protein THAOC_26155 [Thalassiosira oceanica]|uniref:Uncharacterized protein n=1 Tax=Thalassiosira oceanica TaxID=159749 RepID=K0RKK0_THAOC|nr:hypothetical protein THAOC_26155 [Thalassiosira oceanica]|eukprot:EJK54243.1 hypothetical protein THAOC_26155 [Thalassiosira oceanica]
MVGGAHMQYLGEGWEAVLRSILRAKMKFYTWYPTGKDALTRLYDRCPPDKATNLRTKISKRTQSSRQETPNAETDRLSWKRLGRARLWSLGRQRDNSSETSSGAGAFTATGLRASGAALDSTGDPRNTSQAQTHRGIDEAIPVQGLAPSSSSGGSPAGPPPDLPAPRPGPPAADHDGLPLPPAPRPPRRRGRQLRRPPRPAGRRRRPARRGERGGQRAPAQDGPRRVPPAAVRRRGGGGGQEGEGGARLEGRERGRLREAAGAQAHRPVLVCAHAAREADGQADSEARRAVAARRGQDELGRVREADTGRRPPHEPDAPRSHPARPHREGLQRPTPSPDARARRGEEGHDNVPRRRPEDRRGHELDARVLERAEGGAGQDRGEGGERTRAPVRAAAAGGRSGEGAEEAQEEVHDVRARYR